MSSKPEETKPENQNPAGPASAAKPTEEEKVNIEVTAQEYQTLLETVKKQSQQIAAYKMREHNRKVTGNQEPKPEPKPEIKLDEHKHEETKTPEPEKQLETPHYVGPWQKFCPTCGDQNPAFKDETECIDCGEPLGAAANLKTEKNPSGALIACPRCGGHHARSK